MFKDNLPRILLGVTLVVGISGVGQASGPILPRPASKFIHYFEAAGQSRELSMVERAWLALLMTSQDGAEPKGAPRP